MVKVNEDIMGDAQNCFPIVENIKRELSREMKYNDRNDCGNVSAPRLFREQWVAFCSISPLCSMSVNMEPQSVDDSQLIGMKGPAKAVIVAVNEIEKLFKKTVEDEMQARDFVADLYMRISYFCEKLRSIQEV